MEPFFLEDSGQSLYGVFHPARSPSTGPAPGGSAGPAGAGVLLCPAIGQEYLRAHRAFLVLAGRLARAGFPALRFDYQGTGDSSGDAAGVSLTAWIDNIRCAAGELRRRAGVSRVHGVGIRLGASLMVRAAAEGGVEFGRLVLWDPVVRGAGYLDEISRAHREWLAGSFVKRSFSGPERGGMASLEVLGFEMPASLRSEIEALDLIRLEPPAVEKICLVSSDADLAARDELGELRRRMGAPGISIDTREHQESRVWTKIKEDVLDQALVPRNLVDSIMAWLAG